MMTRKRVADMAGDSTAEARVMGVGVLVVEMTIRQEDAKEIVGACNWY